MTLVSGAKKTKLIVKTETPAVSWEYNYMLLTQIWELKDTQSIKLVKVNYFSVVEQAFNCSTAVYNKYIYYPWLTSV